MVSLAAGYQPFILGFTASLEKPLQLNGGPSARGRASLPGPAEVGIS